MSTVLTIDHDGDLEMLTGDLQSVVDYQLQTASTLQEGFSLLAQAEPDALLVDLDAIGNECMPVLNKLHASWPQMPVVVISENTTSNQFIEVMQCGVFQHLCKPVQQEDFQEVIRDALSCRNQSRSAIHLGESPVADVQDDTIIGSSDKMLEVYRLIGRVAATEATVLITGETGTGKELAAQALFHHSNRSDRRFITVNCAAMPEHLVESKLFGHEKGAFTGAVQQRIGKFEQANGATIFLDEIGELSLSEQAKLLRFLEEGTIERIGGSTSIKLDARVIAATNRDLAAECQAGTFREDLFHRLNVLALHLPPLRERPTDIPLLVRYFYRQFTGNHQLPEAPITKGAMEQLTTCSWPGNVRELKHCIHNALILSGGFPITTEDIRNSLLQNPGTQQHAKANKDPVTTARTYLQTHDSPQLLQDFMDQQEAAMLQAALQRTGGNQTHAAKLLGVSRPTVRAKLDKYNIDPKSPK